MIHLLNKTEDFIKNDKFLFSETDDFIKNDKCT